MKKSLVENSRMARETFSTEPGTFWQRQVVSPITAKQVVFDVLVGIVLPILCVIADPIVFRAVFGAPVLGSYKLFGYLTISMGVVTLAFWLVRRRASAFLGGMLLGYALFSFLLGVILLPLSLIGLLLFIGVFGLSPFLTGFSFLRNGIRVLQMGDITTVFARMLVSCGLLASIAVPLVPQVAATQRMKESIAHLKSGSPEETKTALVSLRALGMFADLDRLVWMYQKEEDPSVKQRLAHAYEQLTGKDIKARLAELQD